jgi:pilus assembly protein FimV
MVRVRKLVLAIAAASALSSGMAHALGLGEVTLRSALNQPLLAEIELLETRDLSSDELVPTLASQEAFSKAGVDRQYFLTDLKFTSVVKPNGKSVILVTSTKPMREPYLNFLVEVLWPNGRLLREYTLLLDPPLYTPQSVIPANTQMPVVSAPAPRIQNVPPAPRPTPSVAPVQRSSVAAAPVAPRAPAAPAARKPNDSEYRTTANDTLWEIARSARGSNNVHQVMLAIQDLNPNAFIDGNINRMKSGQVLRLPTDEQIRSRSQQEAVAQVTEQNSAWKERRSIASSARQLDGTRRTEAEPAPAKVEKTDSLKLVAADSGQSTAGSEAGSADSKALANKLAVTQESLDSSRRESEELKSRLEDVQSQLDKLQRLMELKDNQLAKLQADLAAKPSVTETAAAPVVAAPEPAPAVPEAPVAAAEPVVAAAPAEAEPVVAAPVVESPAADAEVDYNYAEEPAPAPTPAPVVEPTPATPAEPIVEAAQAPVAEQSALDKILSNPMWLGLAGGAALLALLLVLMLLSRRNAMKEAELQQSLTTDTDKVDADPEMELPADSFEGLADDFQETQTEPAKDERVTAQTSDALGEADIYIAYGRFPQAAELLEGAVKDEPQRADLRLKLMEVYAEMGEQNGFANQETQLRSIGGVDSEIDQLKARFPAIAGGLAAAAVAGAVVAADNSVDDLNFDDLAFDEPVQNFASDLEVTEPVSVQPEASSADLDDTFDLSLDAFEEELNREFQPSEAVVDVGMDSLSLDSEEFAASLDEVQNVDSGLPDDLNFDLSVADDGVATNALDTDLADFTLDLDAPAEPVAAAMDEDFLLKLDEPPVAAAPVEVPDFEPLLQNASDGEFDLSAEFDLAQSDELSPLPAADSFASQLDKVSAELGALGEDFGRPEVVADAASFDGLDGDDDFDFLSGADETSTKLDLARAYIDMGDAEGARDILSEVINEGNDGQQQEARELIAKLV